MENLVWKDEGGVEEAPEYCSPWRMHSCMRQRDSWRRLGNGQGPLQHVLGYCQADAGKVSESHGNVRLSEWSGA